MKPLTRKIAGDDRPKQFCAIFGERTLLEQTQRRVALVFNLTQTLIVVTRTHEPFYQEQVNDFSSNRLLVQPKNKGTAPAILLSLLRVAQLSPQAVVAFFPSDHYFTDDGHFMSQVDLAFEFVEANAGLITLLGIKPDRRFSTDGLNHASPANNNVTRDSCLCAASGKSPPRMSQKH